MALREVTTLKGHIGRVFSVSYSPDGRTIATGSHDGTAKIWDATGKSEAEVFDRHPSYFATVQFSPDGRLLARSVAPANQSTVWDARSLDKLTVMPYGEVAFSPDGRLLVTPTPPNALTLWDMSQGLPTRQRNVSLSAPPFHQPVFSSDGRRVALGPPPVGAPRSGADSSTVGSWDVARWQRIDLLAETREKTDATVYAFSPDGRLFAIGYSNGSARTWDARTWSKSSSLGGHSKSVQAVAFSPDGRFLATGSLDTTVRLWETHFESEPTVFRGDAGAVYALAFSPDGETLAVGGMDGAVKFWNIRARREVATLKAHDSIACSLAFSPDGRTSATISVDQTMRLWKAPGFSDTDRCPSARHPDPFPRAAAATQPGGNVAARRSLHPGDLPRVRQMEYQSGMKLKTSVTLSEDLVKMVDGVARKGEARSQVLERLVREALTARARKEADERDRDLINRNADALNAEVEDALRYQIDL